MHLDCLGYLEREAMVQRWEPQIHLMDGCSRDVSLCLKENIVLMMIETQRGLEFVNVSVLLLKKRLRLGFSTVTTHEIRHIPLSKIRQWV